MDIVAVTLSRSLKFSRSHALTRYHSSAFQSEVVKYTVTNPATTMKIFAKKPNRAPGWSSHVRKLILTPTKLSTRADEPKMNKKNPTVIQAAFFIFSLFEPQK